MRAGQLLELALLLVAELAGTAVAPHRLPAQPVAAAAAAGAGARQRARARCTFQSS